MKTKINLKDSFLGKRTFWSHFGIVVLTAIIMLLVNKCGSMKQAEDFSKKLSKVTNENKNLKSQIANKIIECNELEKQLNRCEQNLIASRSAYLDLLNEFKKLQSELNYYKNLKYTLVSKRDSSKDATIVSMKRISRKDTAITSIAVYDIYVVDTIYSALLDTVGFELNRFHEVNDSTENLYKNEISIHEFYNLNKEHLSKDPIVEKHEVTYPIIIPVWEVDYDLIEKARRQNVASTIIDLATDIGFFALYHAETPNQFWDNGLEPLDPNNRYKDLNKSELRIAKNRQWIEAGLWGVKGVKYGLNYFSNQNYQNAISRDQIILNATIWF